MSGRLLCLWLAAVNPPEQPIPYSHKQHVALGLKCKDCHTMPDPGELMTIPAAAKCMDWMAFDDHTSARTCHQLPL